MKKTVEAMWRASRAGACAGSGFRFQDAVVAAAAVDCWAGAMDGSAIVPEGLDDFVIESATRATLVQVKSKVADDAEFSAAELSAIFSATPVFSTQSLAVETTQAVVIDRPFAGASNASWTHHLSEFDAWVTRLQPAALQRGGTLITWADPVGRAADTVARKRSVARAAALACVHRLMRIVGDLADANAQSTRTHAERAKITVGEIDREIDSVLNLIDLQAVETATKEGLAEFVSFADALPEENYYEGIATVAGHVAAGLVLQRDDLVDEVLSALFPARRLLIVGPSGAGKSALAYLTGLRTRHACRWIQIRRCSTADREALLRFVSAQEPDDSSPIVLYVDDAGRGGGEEWDFVCDLTLSRRGLFALGCVREEDVAVLPRLPDCRQVRLELDESFARRMWERFREAGKTSWPFWKEPFEQSRGLLLEYAHILSRGQRLRDVVEEQVRRRILEGRETEFEILRLTSAAGSLGASVSSALLAERVGLSGAEFAGALQRLLNEHLLRRTGHDELAALHQLRAKCVLEACLQVSPGTINQARAAALSVVNAEGMRYVLAGAIRAQEFEISDAIAAIGQRLALQSDPAVLTGALEGLKIATLDSDAELFAELARRYHIDPGNYFLIMIALNTALGDDEKSESAVLRALAAIRKEFKARAAPDLRMRLLNALPPAALCDLLGQAQSAIQIQHLVRSLVGLNLGSRVDALMSVGARLGGIGIQEIASTLAMVYELSPVLAHRWVDALGGERALLDRLWQETPWALRPEVVVPSAVNASDSQEQQRVEIRADLLAVTGELLNRPDSIVFAHAARALALAPTAEVVTARPLPVTGEPITVGDYSMGVKRIGRENSPSKATVTWNRMLVHAAASKVETEPVTKVLQRRKETLEIASRLFREHADVRCRGRRPKEKTRNELKALAIVEQIAPVVPLDRPETALGLDRTSSLTDPTGQLIDEIRRACEHLCDPKVRGALLAMEMESIAKSLQSCREDTRWSYIGGAPHALLDELVQLTEDLRQVFLSGVSLGASHDAWARDSGVRCALERARVSAHRQTSALQARLSRVLSIPGVSVSVLAERLSSSKKSHWPGVDVCVLAACDDLVAYVTWLASKIHDLQGEVSNVSSLVVVPVIKEQVVTQCATQLVSKFAPMPDPEFAERWGAHCPKKLHVSSVCGSFDQALESILSLHATKELLGAKNLLPPESTFVDECETRAAQALIELSTALKEPQGEGLADATTFLASMYQNSSERSAAEILTQIMPGADSELASDAATHRLVLIQTDLDRE